MATLRAVLPAVDYLYACRFSSQEETRYYLNGAFVDAANKRLVATDGHRLGILDMSSAMWAAEKAEPFIITNAKAFQLACKGGRKEAVWLRCFDEHVEIVKHASDLVVTAEGLAGSDFGVAATIPAKVAYVDGTFPEYMRVLPRACSGLTYDTTKEGKPDKAVCFNSTYVSSFASSRKNPQVKLVPNGTSPALAFNSDPRFMGVLMPMRGGVLPSEAVAVLDAMFPADPEEAQAA